MEANNGKLPKLGRGRAESIPQCYYKRRNGIFREILRREKSAGPLISFRLYWGSARQFYIPVNIIYSWNRNGANYYFKRRNMRYERI
ncbi:hypothetical protein [Janthinobacterium sp.]|uniref:hypothetical protein n=1 Tax=Janthinobacterium sp. TaxID=1871054 RepID=UPI0025C33C62|nr:hypothetical protein [Janthinobacterium sp.]